MKVFFQMDDLKTINFALDSTWQLILAGKDYGEIYYYTPQNLFFENQVKVIAQKITFFGADFELSEKFEIGLSEADIIFIRQNPPYNMDYLSSTYLLEQLNSNKTLIINNPRAIRDFPEKLSILKFLEFLPKTVVSSSTETILKFAKKFPKIILKPLYSFAGNDVFCCSKDDVNLIGIINYLIKNYQSPIMVQEFLPNIKYGDKRVILIDGEVIGSFRRVPNDTSIKANLVQGGKAYPVELTAKEKMICQELKSFLKENGLFFVGVDLIDERLIEINVTSPTGLVNLKEFVDNNIVDQIWQKILTKINKS